MTQEKTREEDWSTCIYIHNIFVVMPLASQGKRSQTGWMGPSFGVAPPSPSNITDMPKFIPDGSGRDSYISRNNGGLQEIGTLIHPREKKYGGARPFSISPTAPLQRYHPCGDGRDCWRLKTNETSASGHGSPEKKFTSSFRSYSNSR